MDTELHPTASQKLACNSMKINERKNIKLTVNITFKADWYKMLALIAKIDNSLP